MSEIISWTAERIFNSKMSNVCAFDGRRKEPKRAFCFKCFDRLPDDLKKGLYKSISQGFNAAFLAAYDHLLKHREFRWK